MGSGAGAGGQGAGKSASACPSFITRRLTAFNVLIVVALVVIIFTVHRAAGPATINVFTQQWPGGKVSSVSGMKPVEGSPPSALELETGADTEETATSGPVISEEERVLVDDVRGNYLHPPSGGPITLKNPTLRDPSRGQSKVILQILDQQRGGFFVECGALDGETRSNTLYMERYLGWSGLLVEADPSNFRQVLSKQRAAWGVNVCLNNQPIKSKVRFKPAFNVGRIATENETLRAGRPMVEVDCFPLHVILLALNQTRVDYFSLDVEGAELDVLRTIPFHRIDIRTLSVEFAHTTGGGKSGLRAFMEAQGYTVAGEVKQRDWTANDFIFVKNTAFPHLAETLKQEGDVRRRSSRFSGP